VNKQSFKVISLSAYEEHLEIAKHYLEEAYRLLERGDPYDAAEKVWAAVKHSTTALTMRVFKETAPPRGVSWRLFVKEALVKLGLSEEEASIWATYYVDVRDRLRGGCFYGLVYEEEEHRPLIERAREYIGIVEKLLRGRS
jgi:HEPN domain-containing protein